MLRTALIFGLLAGAIQIVIGQIGFSWGESRPELGEVIGYSVMLAALSMIYFGIRNQRDRKQDGHITFGQGLQLGLIITLIATVFYIGGWFIYYHNGGGAEMMEYYWQAQIESIQQSKQSEAEIAAELSRLTEMRESYSKPIVMAGFGFLEIFPIGLLISVVAALLLRRSSNTEEAKN